MEMRESTHNQPNPMRMPSYAQTEATAPTPQTPAEAELKGLSKTSLICLVLGVLVLIVASFLGGWAAGQGAKECDDVAARKEVEVVSINDIMDSRRRRRLTGDSGGASEISHSALTHVTVTKENGEVRRMSLASSVSNADGSMEFVGSDGCVLTFEIDGADPTMVCSDVDAGRDTSSSSRRRLQGGKNGAAPRRGRRLDGAEEAEEAPRRRLSSSSSVCSQAVDSNCRTCIHSQDSWCESNTWDEFCAAGCDGPTDYMPTGCASECAEPAVTDVTGEVDVIEVIIIVVISSVVGWFNRRLYRGMFHSPHTHLTPTTTLLARACCPRAGRQRGRQLPGVGVGRLGRLVRLRDRRRDVHGDTDAHHHAAPAGRG